MKTSFILLALFVVALLVLNNVKGFGKPNHANSAAPDSSSGRQSHGSYGNLRSKALDATWETIGLPAGDSNAVYGVVMDWGVGNGVSTTVCFASGDASIYFSTGSAVIGGFRYEHVRADAKAIVSVAGDYLETAQFTNETTPPDAGEMKFYILTSRGRYVLAGKVAEIDKGASPLLAIAMACNKVVTDLRLLKEGK